MTTPSRSVGQMNTRAPSNLYERTNNSTNSYDSDAPDDELQSNHSGSASQNNNNHGQMEDEFTQQTQSSKRKTRNRPWKKATQYDSIQADDVDVCGVNDSVDNSNDGISVGGVDDHDDDLSYDESTVGNNDNGKQRNTNANANAKAGTADLLGTEDVSSRWSQVQPPSSKEVKEAHNRAVSLMQDKDKNKENDDKYDYDDDDEASQASKKSESSRRSNHQQVRMEALKLLELANSSGRKDREDASSVSSSTRGGGRFKAVRENSARRGLGLNMNRQRKYEKVGAGADDNDVFTTNPLTSPIKGKLDDVEFQNDVDLEGRGSDGLTPMKVDVDGEYGKNTWGSRYSVDRHLLALNGGLTSQQVLNKMDRDHYNKLNQNTSATNMCKASPHEIDDDRWGVKDGRKGEKHKNRLWYTWIEIVKDKVATVMEKIDKTGSHTLGSHRNANHSSPGKGIFTAVAITNFLDRLSPASRARHENGEVKKFDWRNVNLSGGNDEAQNIHFSADKDLEEERKNRRKNMFFFAIFIISLVTLFSIVGVTLHKKNSGRRGGGYIEIGEEIKFFVTGDVPYNGADETKLSRELDNLKTQDGDFLIHLGDITRASSTLCTYSVYDDAASLLKQSPVPVMVIPGDNDWNECPMPEVAFDNWMDKLSRFEEYFDPDDYASFPDVSHQSGRDENFAFLQKGVLFIAVHLISGRVRSEREWSIRDQENLQWVEMQLSEYDSDEYRAIVLLGHAGYSSKIGDFFWPAMDAFRRINKPVLYLHANDGEGMLEYYPVDDFKKFTAVRLEKGSKVAPTQITIGGGSKPFSYVETDEI